jgi:outer membrane protein
MPSCLAWPRRSAALLVAVASFVTFQVACAAPATDLVAALQAARSFDATFFAARAADVAAHEKKAQGDALLAPQVSLATSASEALLRTQVGGAAVAGTQTGQQYGTSIALSKPLYDAGASVTRAQLYKEADQADVVFRQAEQDLMLRTAKAYYEVLVATESVNLVRTQEQAISQQLGLVTESYELGLMTASDVNDATSRRDNVLATEIAARNDLEARQGVFHQLTGLDSTQLVPLPAAAAPAVPQPQTLSDWLSRAQAQNLSIRSLELSVDIAHSEIDRYTLRHSPVLSLVGSAGRSWDIGSIATAGGRDATTSAAIGVQLSIPLYDGGARVSRLRQAYALEDQQRYTLEAARRDTERATRFYFSAVRDNALRVRALEQARVSSAAAVESTQLGREVGVRTTIDVLNSQQAYYQTLLNLASARYDYQFSRIQLAATAGELDESVLREVSAAQP